MPGAEKLIPNIRRLTNAAKDGKVFLVSHGCFHVPNDPEFKIFLAPLRERNYRLRAPSRSSHRQNRPVPDEVFAKIPDDLSEIPADLLEKKTLNIFESRHADTLVEKLGNQAEFVVFGVITEFCVGFAAKGLLERKRRVALVTDAIETLRKEDGETTIAELKALGARLTTTDEAPGALG